MTDLVSVQLQGGLGNQLFQIATAYAYSRRTDKKLVADHATTSTAPRPTYFDTIFPWVADEEMKDSTEVAERAFAFAPLSVVPGNVLLTGYFQSSKYFEAFRSELLFHLRKPELLPQDHPLVAALLQHKRTDRYVSLHVRRGDYVGHSKHPTQTLEFYQKAWEQISAREHAPLHLVIFSDDLAWCREHLNLNNTTDCTYVDFLSHDYQELQLMSLCDHHIIANSSFSWWGAYLDNKSYGITVAPANWFQSEISEWKDLYCRHWLVV